MRFPASGFVRVYIKKQGASYAGISSEIFLTEYAQQLIYPNNAPS